MELADLHLETPTDRLGKVLHLLVELTRANRLEGEEIMIRR
jgi:hypothetical protein